MRKILIRRGIVWWLSWFFHSCFFCYVDFTGWFDIFGVISWPLLYNSHDGDDNDDDDALERMRRNNNHVLAKGMKSGIPVGYFVLCAFSPGANHANIQACEHAWPYIYISIELYSSRRHMRTQNTIWSIWEQYISGSKNYHTPNSIRETRQLFDYSFGNVHQIYKCLYNLFQSHESQLRVYREKSHAELLIFDFP